MLLVDLSNNTCIPNTIKSLPSSCTYSNSQHIPLIENLFPGVILLNDYNDTILVDNVKRHLSGTFLIKFTNTTIVAQDKIYRNLEAPQMATIPAGLQPTPAERGLEKLLTIESLNELHLSNTHEIGTVKMGTIINGVSTMFFLLLLVAMGFLIFHLYKISQKSNAAKLNMENSYSSYAPAVILANTQPGNNKHSSNFRINDLPYF